MQMIDNMPNMDFIFGFPGNVKLQTLAEPTGQRACALWTSVQTQEALPESVRLFDEFAYAARSWPKPWRVLLRAEVMAQGENPRYVVTSLVGLDAGTLYEDISARAASLKISSSICRTTCRPTALPVPVSSPIACACCCMPPTKSCISSCAPRHCSIPAFRKPSRQR